MSAGVPYLGSKISLISKSEIRYEGILYTIDTNESTVALAKVKSFGTEDRPTDRPVAPREEVYEYIIFRGSDIKDIRVCHPPKPQPTLQGGLPNDPAIVQHSANEGGASGGFASPSGSNRRGGGRSGSGGFGPIGAGTGGFGGGSSGHPGAPFAAAPGAQLDSSRAQGGSPVMDMLNSSRTSSPTARGEPGSPGSGGRGRGAPQGFHRGTGASRGGRGGGGVINMVGGPRGGARGGTRGGFIPGRPSERKKDTLKFDNDYDFEQANEQFAEVLSKLQKTTINGDRNENNDEKAEKSTSDTEDGEIKEDTAILAVTTAPGSDDDAAADEGDPPEPFYNKSKSFFDSISCEALERSKGNLNKPDWRAEKKLNKETFGVSGGVGGYRRGYGYRGGNRGWGGGYRRGYGYRGGYGGYGGGNGGQYNNNYNNSYGGGRFSRDQRTGGGDGNYHRGRGRGGNSF